MAWLKKIFYLLVSVASWMMANAEEDIPKAENVHWVSLDFKTLLKWTVAPSNYSFSVQYIWEHGDEWKSSSNCIRISETECDLSDELQPPNREFSADVQTEPEDDLHYDVDEFPHTFSAPFNPYQQSEISAPEFTVELLEEGKASVTIEDPLTSFHKYGTQLSIRDILKNDLQYKISYYKSGSTGKRDIVTKSNKGEVAALDVGQSYCFMVAAYIPARPKAHQQGAWSIQQCTPGQTNILQELSLGALVGGLFILVVVLVVIITVTVLCCRRRNGGSPATYQSSAVV
ncbi:tissue factor-like [Stigmatopora argus]